MNDNFDNTRVRLRGTMNRMLRMAERTGVGWRVWMMFILAVMGLFSWVWLFWCWIDIGCLVCWRNVGMGLGLFFFRGRSERRERVDGLLGCWGEGRWGKQAREERTRKWITRSVCDSSGLMRDLVLRPLWKIESLKVTVFFFLKKKVGGGELWEKKKTPPFPGKTGCPPTMIYLFVSSREWKTKRKRKNKIKFK